MAIGFSEFRRVRSDFLIHARPKVPRSYRDFAGISQEPL